jgi:Leucine-rich repeat (LRR) protein
MSIEIYLQSRNIFKNYNTLKEIPNEYDEDVIYICMVDMNITGISRIGKRFPNIETLEIGCNKIKTLDLTNFTNLVSLFANKNQIFEIIGLSKCLKLDTLELQCNKIQYLEQNNSLKRLCIPANKLKKLFNFPNLEILDIRNNFNFEQIINCPKLKTIHADGTLLKKEQFNDLIEFIKDY